MSFSMSLLHVWFYSVLCVMCSVSRVPTCSCDSNSILLIFYRRYVHVVVYPTCDFFPSLAHFRFQCNFVSKRKYLMYRNETGLEVVFLYYCLDSPSCLAYLNNISWATWAIWAAITNYNLYICFIHFSQTFQIQTYVGSNICCAKINGAEILLV